MKARLVDAEKVKQLKERSIRYKHQNVYKTRQIGQMIEDVLKELDLWKEVGDERMSGEKANSSTEEVNCICRAGSGEVVGQIR